jgi:DNA-binding NtrC family response regulator
MTKILVIDDEKSIRNVLSDVLPYDVDLAENGKEGLEAFKKGSYDAVLCDIKMPEMDGEEVLEKAMEFNPEVPFIMISGHADIDTAVECIKKGAFDFIEKPPDLKRLQITIKNAIEKKDLVSETKILKKKVSKRFEMIGDSEPMQKIREMIDRVAPTDARVLITGSNGTGKELVAHHLHEKSSRAGAPFVEVNCAAIPSELIESVDVRVLAATNKNLRDEIENNNFREDLYHRLSVIIIDVPSLNERKDDITLLADYFLEVICQEHGTPKKVLTEGALKALQNYNYTGNIREFRNLIERLIILSPEKITEPSNMRVIYRVNLLLIHLINAYAKRNRFYRRIGNS